MFKNHHLKKSHVFDAKNYNTHKEGNNTNFKEKSSRRVHKFSRKIMWKNFRNSSYFPHQCMARNVVLQEFIAKL